MFSFGESLGKKDGHLGGEPGVLVMPWAIAKKPVCLATGVLENS